MPVLHWRQFLLEGEPRSLSGAVINKCKGSMCGLLRVGSHPDRTVLMTSSKLGAPPEVQLMKCDASGCETVEDLRPNKQNRYRVELGGKKVELDIKRGSASRLDVSVGGLTPEPTVLHYYADRDTVTMGADASLMRGGTKVRLGRSHGYGMFAAEDIRAGEVVEEAPLLSQPTPFLSDYTFTTGGKHVLPLGHISLYNHSDEPSCDHKVDKDVTVLTLVARRPIKAGEELSINYGPAWFKARGIEPRPLMATPAADS